VNARRLLIGDWTPWVRDVLDVVRLTFLAGAIVTLALGDTAAALRLFLTFLATVAVARLMLPRLFDAAFLLGMALQAWGNTAQLFTTFDDYDVIVHFVLPLACAPALYIMLARWEVVPDLGEDAERHHLLGVWVVTVALGLSLGALYEIYEWVSNHLVGSDLKVGYADTIADLTDDALASVIGGVLLVVWATRGWGTTRRLPGDVVRRRLDDAGGAA
jgi:uncharacterized membrane protein YjdF